MDGAKILRGILAWLALLAAAPLVLMMTWASMRSLYWPSTGGSLGFDATVGFLLGALLVTGVAFAYRRLDEEDATMPLPWIVAVALAAGGITAFLLMDMTWSIARESTGFLDGIEYSFVAIAGLVWVGVAFVAVLVLDRSWRGYFSAALATTGALGVNALLFGLLLLARAEDLRAAARARRRAEIPVVELAFLLATLAAVALARRRRG
jgi:hypothetical protein